MDYHEIHGKALLRALTQHLPLDRDFLADLGAAPSDKHVLALREQKLGYTKGNVLWSLPEPKHGGSIPPGSEREYNIWRGMKQRCYNPNNKDYPRYGGRGITIEERWLRSFYAFYHDMGPCPEGYSIERKKVNEGYSADNCIWASDKMQRLNKRTTKYVPFNGTEVPLRVYCDLYSLDYRLTHKRLSRGWSLEECRTTVPSRSD